MKKSRIDAGLDACYKCKFFNCLTTSGFVASDRGKCSHPRNMGMTAYADAWCGSFEEKSND